MSEHVLSMAIPADHPAYAGHFPGRPILPGVVLLDETLHALAARLHRADAARQLKSVKFLSPVRPGEALSLRYTESPGAGVRFELRSGDGDGGERVVASGSVVFSQAAAA
jgi:3-hydroxymyristoyl/3-hydroxydecanoyl-(acyl carrier protein) dehydratase